MTTLRTSFQTTNWPALLLNLALIVGGGLVVSLLIFTVDKPVLIGIILAAPLVGLAVLIKPEWGLLLLVFMTYTRLSDALIDSRGAPSVAKPFVAFLLAVIVARWLLDRKMPQNWERPTLFLVGYGVIGLFSMLHAANPDAVEFALKDFVKDAIIMLMVAVLLKRAVTLRRVIWALLAAGIFLGSISVFQQVTGTFENNYLGFAQATQEHIVGQTHDFRVGGPGLGANGYAQFMLFLVPLALERLWNERKKELRLLAAWALAVCALTVLFTFSRNAFVGLIIVLALMFIRRPPKPLALVATAVMAALLLQFMPARYLDRMSTLTDLLPGVGQDARNEVSFRGRLSENISGVQMFMDHPIVGVGLHNFKHHYQSYSRRLGLDPRREARSAHSLYLEIASELGIIGLFWFGLLQWVTFTGLRQAQLAFKQAKMPEYEGLIIAFGIALIGFLWTSLFRHMAFPRYVWLIYGIALAIPYVSQQALARYRADASLIPDKSLT